MEFANPTSGVSRFSGTAINIQVPGYGNVLADRGTITIDFTTNEPTGLFEGGPHPFSTTATAPYGRPRLRAKA